MKPLLTIVFFSLFFIAPSSAQRIGRHVVVSSAESLSFLAFSNERFEVEDATLQISLESNLPASVAEKVKLTSRFKDVSPSIEVYSNPLLRKVIVRAEIVEEENMVSIFDSNGAEVNLPKVFGQDLQLDFDRQPTGVFYLVIHNSIRKTMAKFRIVKSG